MVPALLFLTLGSLLEQEFLPGRPLRTPFFPPSGNLVPCRDLLSLL